jgi:hypothetical protein
MGTGGLFLRKLRARVASEPTGFVWVEEGKLAGSGYPASRSQVEWLTSSGIRSILTLTPEPLPPEWTAGLELTVGHVAMEDHEAPSVGAMTEGVRFITDQLRLGSPVVVHCLAGEGRTGCVLAAFLITERHMDGEEAIKALRRVKPRFVEHAQEKSVYEYARGMKL